MLKHFTALLVIFFISFSMSCSPAKKAVAVVPEAVPEPVPVVSPAPIPVDSSLTDSFFVDILKQRPQYFDSILSQRKEWNVQIIYTQVDRGANGIPTLTHHYFNLNPATYFYPASTVKFPVSLLALQKLNELKISGLDKNTTMITEHDYGGQSGVYNDPTTPFGAPSISQYIKKILMVSDNDAFNRLYEFLGQEYINDQLHKKGYGDVQLLHRLNIFLSHDENRHTNPVKFLRSDNRVIYEQPMQFNTKAYLNRSDSMGHAYYRNGQLVNEPMDFSLKNRMGLQDLHNILISLVFPTKVSAEQRFNLTEEDRNFVLKYMSQYPTESTFPPYSADAAAYWPAYCKFLLYGSQKGTLPKNVRIFNKVGDAYGQLTDVAYIVDFEKKVEFFLSATIYCNKNNIISDDTYNYDDLGFPFMKHLGEVIYNYEANRKKEIIPDLSNLRFTYDK